MKPSLLCCLTLSSFLTTTAAAEIPDYDTWTKKEHYKGNPITFINPNKPAERVKCYFPKVYVEELGKQFLYVVELYMTSPERYYEREPCPKNSACFHYGKAELGIVVDEALQDTKKVEDIRLTVLKYFKNLYEITNPESIRIRFRSFQ